MKKSDIILLSVITVLALVSLFVVRTIQNNTEVPNGTAFVIFNNKPILEIELKDGSYEVLQTQHVFEINEENFTYIVNGTNGPVTIEYKDGKVRVIDETSPKNICQDQGWSNSTVKPITCLPNNLVIVIKDESIPSEIDGTG